MIYLDLDTCAGIMFSQLSKRKFWEFILSTDKVTTAQFSAKGKDPFFFFSLNRSSANAYVFSQFYQKISFIKSVHVYGEKEPLYGYFF